MKTIFSSGPEPIFGGQPLKVVRHATARVMRLRVDPRDGAVRLTLPRRASLRRAYVWVEEQRPWVEAQLARTATPVRLVPGAVLEVFGERVELKEGCTDHHVRVSTSVDRDGEGRALIISGDPPLFQARALRWLKREALRVLEHETRTLAARANIAVRRIGVGDPRSRWGSCSAAGDIRYSWRLILAPPFVLRSTVAHELAHRVHMNHGPAFKALELELFGDDPSAARDWLRTNGARLHQYGRS